MTQHTWHGMANGAGAAIFFLLLFIFASLFIEGIFGWKLNSHRINYNLYYKKSPQGRKTTYISITLHISSFILFTLTFYK